MRARETALFAGLARVYTERNLNSLIRKKEFYMTLIFLAAGNLCYMFYTNLQKVLNTTVTRKLKTPLINSNRFVSVS